MIYADYNATAPVRPEAKAAMMAALDVAVGHPDVGTAAGQPQCGLKAQSAGRAGDQRRAPGQIRQVLGTPRDVVHAAAAGI